MGDISQMLDNHDADSWSDVSDSDSYVFGDASKQPLTRLESYVGYCFETYSVLDTLDRDQIQTCIADWGRRRGQCKYDARMAKREFGQRVTDSTHRNDVDGNYAVFVAEALVGVPPEDDNGAGWKGTVRHELGHAIDHHDRGTSGHDAAFKRVMRSFGEGNDGMSQHGWPPRRHR